MRRQLNLYIFMIAIILISSLVACSEKEVSDVDEDGKVKISVFAPQDSEEDLKSNSFSQFVEEKFNIDFDWQTTTYDVASATETRSIAMASGDYPDMFLLVAWLDQFSQGELIKYGRDGAILPLNDLIKEHAPNIQSVLDSHEYFSAMATAPDGNIYGLPQINECYHCQYRAKMWINQTWLDALNLDMPTTHEEFKEVLQAFKTEDPNGNGEADEVPVSGIANMDGGGTFTFLMNGFIYDDGDTRLLLEDDKVDFAPIQPEWKEGLAYIKDLYDEGLIDPGTFSQNQEALSQLGGAEEMILGAAVAHHVAMIASDLEIHNQYEVVPPLEGPNHSYGQFNYPSYPGGTFVLTNKASEEAQVAAIKLIDYMFTEEGQIRAHFGEEGTSWIKPEEGDLAINEDVEPIVKPIPLEEGEDNRNDSWGAMTQYYQSFEFRDAWVSAEDIYSAEGYERRLQEATYSYEGTEPEEVFPHWAIWLDPDLIDEVVMMETNINNYIDQSAVQFITGEMDLESEWDSYIEGYNQLDLERYLEIMEEAYNNAEF